MLPVMSLGLGVGLVLAGVVLLSASFTHQKRMRDPALIRWAGAVMIVIGILLVVIALFWR
jgi:cytochrome c biogenesis protein CcdA